MTSDRSPTPVERPEEHPFHPREIWVSVVLMVVGMLIGAAAVIELSWAIAAAAGAVFVLGVLLAWNGHIFRNVHLAAPMDQERRQLEHPAGSEGIDPGEVGHVARSGSTSSQSAVDRQAPDIHARRQAVAPSPSSSDKAAAFGFVVLLAGLWLLVVPWFLTNGVEDRSVAVSHWRDMVVAVVAILAGLRAVITRGASVGSSIASFAAGGALVLLSALSSVPATRIRVDEIAVGVVIMAAALLQLANRPEAASSDGPAGRDHEDASG